MLYWIWRYWREKKERLRKNSVGSYRADAGFEAKRNWTGPSHLREDKSKGEAVFSRERDFTTRKVTESMAEKKMITREKSWRAYQCMNVCLSEKLVGERQRKDAKGY